MGIDGIGADAALPGMRGLLRTVRTPEFAGTVFHEVEARSVLNRVSSSSPVPFGWTVNPYRGCSHACTYCLAGDTPVLTGDGRTRPIAELRRGDEVVGTVADGAGRRRFVRTPVLAHWSTRRRAQQVSLSDGTELVTSAEHRFLTRQGWAHVRPGRCRASADRPHLRPGAELVGPGAAALPHRAHPPGYEAGYLCGLVRADAVRGRVTAEPFPSAWVELEAVARAHHLLTRGVDAPDRSGAGRTRTAVACGAGAAAPVRTRRAPAGPSVVCRGPAHGAGGAGPPGTGTVADAVAAAARPGLVGRVPRRDPRRVR
ncbi:hypothetical protein [Pseudonocardia sp. HH130630-07]|uniref:hypothetical protein n=1 Tax=Pseudonocardia sp. HH130630-07 TaxID=1690815 RepID=UPI001E605CFD|nr:hypothetical protein [Pseudonocardia sp. HH130630-07]